jgi:hypothetical protein
MDIVFMKEMSMNKIIMIMIILLTSLISITSCSDKKSQKTMSQKEMVLSKKQQWADLKSSISGDYQMFYINTGFTPNKDTKYFVEVRDGKISTASSTTGDLTMDDLYQRALDVIANENCDLEISFQENRPIITKLYASCASEGSGVDVVEFYEGHQINF